MLRRRTSMVTSTITTPLKAAIDEAWPDGNDWLSRKRAGCCHSGRSRPTVTFIPVVASAVTSMTPTVKTAARRWERWSMNAARTTVRMVIPTVPNAVSTSSSTRSVPGSSMRHWLAPRPRLSRSTSHDQSWRTARVSSPSASRQAPASASWVARDRSSTGRGPFGRCGAGAGTGGRRGRPGVPGLPDGRANPARRPHPGGRGVGTPARWRRGGAPDSPHALRWGDHGPSPQGWRPQLIALDIDGTLLKWVDGAGTTYETIAPRVTAAIRQRPRRRRPHRARLRAARRTA